MSGPYLANLQKPTLHRSLSCHKPWEVRSDGQSSACNHNFFMSPKAAKKSESSPITNKTLCVSCWDKQLTDLSAEKITKMILEGTFFPENIQCNILAKPWKIKFWCGNCISSHTRNAFGKQFKLIHGQKTNKHFFLKLLDDLIRALNKRKMFLHALFVGLVILEICQAKVFLSHLRNTGRTDGWTQTAVVYLSCVPQGVMLVTGAISIYVQM